MKHLIVLFGILFSFQQFGFAQYNRIDIHQWQFGSISKLNYAITIEEYSCIDSTDIFGKFDEGFSCIRMNCPELSDIQENQVFVTTKSTPLDSHSVLLNLRKIESNGKFGEEYELHLIWNKYLRVVQINTKKEWTFPWSDDYMHYSSFYIATNLEQWKRTYELYANQFKISLDQKFVSHPDN